MDAQLLKGGLDTILLAALSRDEAHGYALLETIRARSEGAFELAEGTLYPALHRLEGKGWIASDWQMVDRRRRRVYRLTGPGRQELASRSEEWRRFRRGLDALVSLENLG